MAIVPLFLATLATLSHAVEGEEPTDTPAFTASMTGVAQRISDGWTQHRTNYRGDITATFPMPIAGGADGKAFAHVRFGNGKAATLRPTYTSTTNSTACLPGDGPDSSFAVLAQAWYQMSRSGFEITAGKLDPFAFFDQNAIADDETIHFLNNAFVHQPLLDSGGDIGSDAHGFAPGVRIAYTGAGWAVSTALFSLGSGKAFAIAQFEFAETYRLYAWRHPEAVDYDGRVSLHTGLGLSADQRITPHVTMFTRLGRQMAGRARFERVATLGTEIDMSSLGRAEDAVGVAAGWLRSGPTRPGSERVGEIYYRMQPGPRIQLTTDFQWIRRPAGDAGAPTIRAFALRAKIAY